MQRCHSALLKSEFPFPGKEPVLLRSHFLSEKNTCQRIGGECRDDYRFLRLQLESVSCQGRIKAALHFPDQQWITFHE